MNDGFFIFSNLVGFHAPNGGVISPHILVTNLKPDLFIVNDSTEVLLLLELTCSLDGNINRSLEYLYYIRGTSNRKL